MLLFGVLCLVLLMLLVFVARLGLWGVGECLPRTGCELWVIKMGVLVGVRELQCYGFGACSDI